MEEFDCLPRSYISVPLAGELRVTTGTIVWRSRGLRVTVLLPQCFRYGINEQICLK